MSDPSYLVLPSFVGLRMLMDLSKTLQNLRRRRLLRVEDWWRFRHQLMTDVSMNVFPSEFYPHWRFYLVHPPILQWCRTFASKWELLNSWWNFKSWDILSHECRRIHRRSHENSPYHWMFLFCGCNVGRNLCNLPLLELIKSGCFDWLRCVFPYFTDCAAPSRRVSPWWGRICWSILQEVLSGCLDRSCVVTLTFPLLRRPSTVINNLLKRVCQVALIYHLQERISKDPVFRSVSFTGSLKLKMTRPLASSQ